MEQIIGGGNSIYRRVTHIDFLKNKIILLFLFLVSCSSGQNPVIKQYSNFIYYEKKNDGKKILKSRIASDNSILNQLTYNAVIDSKNESQNASCFELNRKKTVTPFSFKNKSDLKYDYSLMPHYTDNKETIAKSFEFKNGNLILIIKGENPFCNGTNCSSYYVHLLIIKNSIITSNFVYLFDYKKNSFDNMIISTNSNNLVFSDKQNIIDKIILVP